MNNEQENKNPEEITTEKTNETNKLSWSQELRKDFIGDFKENVEVVSITTMGHISNGFYGISILSVITLFMFLSGVTLSDIEVASIQGILLGTNILSIFMFFSFGKLFEVVNRIDKNTRK